MASSQTTSGRLIEVVKNAIGPMAQYAMGYMNPVGPNNMFGSQGTGYIATMKLSVATVAVAGLDEGTEGIVSYDRCETADANIGQINMGTASSFCGLNGALWGYHIAKVGTNFGPLFCSSEPFDSGELSMFDENERKRISEGFPVYGAGPLLDATERLFGHVAKGKRRHPPLPGSHVVCANKNATVRGPAYAWAFLAIAIAKDPEHDSSLFIEDCGTFNARISNQGEVIPDPEQVKRLLEDHQKNVVKSIVLCGQDYDSVEYGKAFISSKAIYAGPGEVACALACAPYILLAQEDVPRNKVPEDLIDISLADWEKLVWPDHELATTAWGPDGVIVIGPQG
ncbi:MAG TPA: histidine decarboxylase, pyruvoyl type [Pseudonocardiaceae bacterium]|nr:histidine decarboxylase, pyruvoyl type [Pseudonocardiaceae bacterium]